MKNRHFMPSITVLFALLLAACSSQPAIMSQGEMEAEVMVDADDEKMADDAMADESMEVEDMNHGGDEMAEKGDEAMMEEGDGMMEDAGSEMESKDQMAGNDEMMDAGEDAMPEDKDDDMANDARMSPGWFEAPLIDVHTGQTFTIADFKGKVVLVETLAMWCSNCFKQQGQVKALHDLLGEEADLVSLGIDIDPNENAEALKTYTDNNGFDWLYTVAPREVAREIGQLYGDQFLNPPSTPMLIIDRQGNAHPLPFGIKIAESLLDALQPFLEGDM